MYSTRKSLFISLSISFILGIIINLVYSYEKQISELNRESIELKREIGNLLESVIEKDSLLDEQREIIHRQKEKIQDKDADIYTLNEKLKNTKEEKKKAEEKMVSRGSSDSNKVHIYEVTAYHAGFESTGKRKGDKGYGITASGAKVQEGVTIACPPEIPFGTKIKIQTVGIRVCQDRGSAIQGKIIDLYIANPDEVWEWGRRKLMVEILN